MLGWLAAAAAPILIHLWMRHAHRDTPWAAMEFLREAIKRNARRMQLQQWLLLAARTLLLLLLALAAAKPYLSGWNLLSGGPKVHRLLVLDASMSMQYAPGDQSAFERAKRLAGDMLENGQPGDVYSICLMADPPQIIVAGPVADVRRAQTQLASLEATFAGADLDATLDVVEELVARASSEQRDLATHEVLFLTDLAAHSWQSVSENPATARQIEQLAAKARCTIVDVSSANPANIAVSSLRVAGSLVTTAQPVRLECDVANHSASPAANVVVQLMSGDASIDEATVTLATASQTTVSFDARLPDVGWQSLCVRTAGDGLAADDSAWLAIDVRPRVRTLLVEGTPGAARYLRYALDPSGGYLSPIEAIVVPEGALMEMPLDEFAAIFLCNVARFTENERQLLDRYTKRGGSLVFFLGDRVLPETYNDILATETLEAPRPALVPAVFTGEAAAARLVQNETPPAEHGATLLPATLGPLESSADFGLNPLDHRHPIAAAFQGSERAGLLSTPVSRYYKLEPASDAEVALALPNGDAFLVTAPRGAGMVAVVATSASLDTVDPATGQPWTMLPAWPSFLPIVRELLVYAVAHGRDVRAATVGKPLGGTLPASWSDASVEMLRPDGRVDTIPVMRTPSYATWSYTSTDIPGVYAVRSAAGTEPIAMAAINTPQDESNLARRDVESLPANLSVRMAPPDFAADSADLVAETKLHRWLLYAVLVLLLVEPVMAWAFAGRAG